MKGQPASIDRGGIIDMVLRAIGTIGARASARAEDRLTRRRAALALPPGTKVRITGKCCRQADAGRIAVIHSYVDKADGYRVRLPEGSYESYNAYLCANGFEVLNQ